MRTATRAAFLLLLAACWFPPVLPGQESAAASGLSQGLRQLAIALGQDPGEGEPIKCGFPLLVGARRGIGALPPELRSATEALIARPVLQTSILRYGYRIHFDTTGANVPALLDAQGQRIAGTALAFAESTATSLAYVESIEVGQLGYPPPVPDGTEGGGPEPDIYIMNLGNSYGMTNTDSDVLPAGGRSTCFVTIDNDFSFVRPVANRGIPALKVTVAHEYHHLIQIGNYGLWPDDVYFYEMTSTWLEDVVYTDVNDYYNYLRSTSSQFQTPDVAFTSNALIEYSRAIWGHFIAKAYGAPMMRRSWEFVREERPLLAIDAALREGGSSFALAFAQWTRWNYYTGSRADPARYYPEGANYPEIVQAVSEYIAPSSTLTGSVQPTGARYHLVLIPRTASGFDTLSVAPVNYDMNSALALSPGTQPYTVTIRSDQPDASFRQTGAGLYASFSTGNPSLWTVWFFVGSNSYQPFGAGSLAEGTAFPNPWMVDGSTSVSIPVDGTVPLTGKLQIYDASMKLIYASEDRSLVGTARQFCSWDGITDSGRLVASGVYVYLLALSDGRIITGKIAVLRR